MTETATEEKPTVEQSSQVKDSSETKETSTNSLPNSPNGVETSANPGKSGTASVWVDLAKLKAFRVAVKLQGTSSLSDELNQFFDKRTAEIKGLVPNGSNNEANSVEAEVQQRRQSYEVAKRRTFDLNIEIAKMQKFFEEQKCWNDYVRAFCRAIDYDKMFDPPTVSYEHSGSGKAYDVYCLRFIEEASDRETEFKEQSTRFLLKYRDVEFCYTWIGFVEKLKERRKLNRQMLMYHLDSLSPEQRLQLEKEEADRKEALRLKREEEARVKQEREQRQRDEETKERAEMDRMFDQEEDESEGDGEEEDDESSDEDVEYAVEPPIDPLPVEEKQPCRAIVPVGGD